MKIKTSDILITGLALFAIFFGAGNLIFPPYLGVVSGQAWWQAIGGFLTSDPLFPILGVLVTIQLGGQACPSKVWTHSSWDCHSLDRSLVLST